MGSTRSKVHPRYKGKYRVMNWPDYDRALRRRGELTFWFTPSLVKAWIAPPNGRPGGQRKYSDGVIELALALRLLFGLRWRQTEGFLASVLELMGLELDVPDHTTLSRRTRDLDVALAPLPSDQPLQLVLDSTGLAVFGQGEWATAKWGGRGRRGWKKLHIAVDQEGQIRAAVLTEPTCTDPAVAPALLERVEDAVCEVIADGAYDQRLVYQAIHDKGARSVIPPSKAAKISGEPVHRERDAHLERIEKVGRRQWRRESRHHQQSREENSFFRFKFHFGGRLRARHSRAQLAEAMVACRLLNTMTALGRPRSRLIDA